MASSRLNKFQEYYFSICWQEKNLFQSFMKKTAFFVFNKANFRSTIYNYIFKKNYFQEKLISKKITRSLYFELTNRCNAACVFCPYPEMKRPYKYMSMDLFKDTIDQYSIMGGKSVGFTPIVGDPMLDKHILERIDYIENETLINHLSFYSNGIAFVPKKIDQLLVERKLDISVSLSFGGYDQESYKKVMGVDMYNVVKKNLIYLLTQYKKNPIKNLKLKIDYRYPEEFRNDELSILLEEAKERKLITSDTLGGVFDTFGGNITQKKLDEANMDFKLHYGHPKVGPCAVLYWKPIILADGKVNACAERDLETDLIIGDLNQEKLKDIIYGEKMESLMESFNNKKNMPKVCQKCTVYQSIYNPSSKVWSNGLNWITN